MELENTQNNALAKLPMLKLGEYEMWEIRIKQYFQIQDYAIWEVIENGNSWLKVLLDLEGISNKMTHKALLKQQYENFNASSSELLDSIFNTLQKLVSRLAILGVVTPPEDLNVKFLRSLPSNGDTHVVSKRKQDETEPIIQEVTPTEVSTAGATKGTASEVPVVSTAEENISTAGRTLLIDTCLESKDRPL
ncbi:hypothetical protein Tco_0786756, partial [Tanacetum coccineum]